MNITVKEYPSTTLELSEDGEWLCNHEEAYIERACCSNPVDSNGNITCGCYGRDSVICPAWDCTGIEDWQVDDLFDRLETWEEDEI